MAKTLRIFLLLIVFVAVSVFFYVRSLILKIESTDPLVWADDIEQFEEQDKATGIVPGSVLFVGSSSVALYDGLEKLMSPHEIKIRGFGGASVSDIRFYRARIIDRYSPGKIIIYAGAIDAYYENKGQPLSVVQNIQSLISEILKFNPKAKIYYIAIRSSPYDPDVWNDNAEINNAIQNLAQQTHNFYYINANDSVKDEQGNWRKDIYKYDRTHLNNEGNALWWKSIRDQIFEL